AQNNFMRTENTTNETVTSSQLDVTKSTTTTATMTPRVGLTYLRQSEGAGRPYTSRRSSALSGSGPTCRSSDAIAAPRGRPEPSAVAPRRPRPAGSAGAVAPGRPLG